MHCYSMNLILTVLYSISIQRYKEKWMFRKCRAFWCLVYLLFVSIPKIKRSDNTHTKVFFSQSFRQHWTLILYLKFDLSTTLFAALQQTNYQIKNWIAIGFWFFLTKLSLALLLSINCFFSRGSTHNSI